MKLYIAGKVSKDSVFGTHHWRDNFVGELAELSGLELSHLDPVKYEVGAYEPQRVFNKDCWLINQADCVVVYLSDDISVGGSQEMLIAKYLKKPLIGLAPFGGKFQAAEFVFKDVAIQNYVDPFVYATCDVLCKDIGEVAEALKMIKNIQPKTAAIIDVGVESFRPPVL